jgi:hypothetical protein
LPQATSKVPIKIRNTILFLLFSIPHLPGLKPSIKSKDKLLYQELPPSKAADKLTGTKKVILTALENGKKVAKKHPAANRFRAGKNI